MEKFRIFKNMKQNGYHLEGGSNLNEARLQWHFITPCSPEKQQVAGVSGRGTFLAEALLNAWYQKAH